MTDSCSPQLEEGKIKASILLKQLRSDDPGQATQAAARFQRLPHLSKFSTTEILQQKAQLKRKHALNVIALELNAPNWAEFKQQLEQIGAPKPEPYTRLYPRRCNGFLNEWFADYETARRYRAEQGGYLLPYRSHFFICGPLYIKTLGLDPTDPAWERIGWDWVQPADKATWNQLDQMLQAIEAGLASTEVIR